MRLNLTAVAVHIYRCDGGKSNCSYRLLSQCVCLCVSINTKILAHTQHRLKTVHTHVCNQLSGNPEWINWVGLTSLEHIAKGQGSTSVMEIRCL